MTKIYKSLCTKFVLLMFSTVTFAQSVEFNGVRNTMRYDDGDDTKSVYLGWNAELGKAEFSGDYGLWSLAMDGTSIKSDLVHYENLMYGNSGSFYMNGYIYTIMSHEDPDADSSDVWEFVVRKWDAKTYSLVSSSRFPTSANLESAGLAYNPKDGKVYGLFYLTDVSLPNIDGYVPDEDDIETGRTNDAGYALCTIDLETMQISQITPGIYYDNFVTLACSPEGRLFAMTSGGSMAEFDTTTGLMRTKKAIIDDEECQVNYYENSGVQSQYKRQSACFNHKTGKMYWNGFVNSGKGVNEWGSWSSLPDREWRTNGKYDTALYEVDTETGKATKIANIPNRIAFSALWVVGADGTDTAPTSIELNNVDNSNDKVKIYNAAGQLINKASMAKGMYIVKKGNVTKKFITK